MAISAEQGAAPGLFTTVGEFVAALRRVPECYDPKTTSILFIRGCDGRAEAEPFHGGFLSRFEERAEVIRLLGEIDQRSRRLLVMWFVEGIPVARIARCLRISRVHCYRLKDQALRRMLHDRPDRADGHNGSVART
jgi:DNA-directed RNA polymerase specialized sigma24 family protein